MNIGLIITLMILGIFMYIILGFIVSLFYQIFFYFNEVTEDYLCLFIWPFLLLHLLLYFLLNLVKRICLVIIEIINMFKEW